MVFEPAIPVFEREKTFGALDSSAVYILLAHYPLLIKSIFLHDENSTLLEI
jgi:hypothetical protein